MPIFKTHFTIVGHFGDDDMEWLHFAFVLIQDTWVTIGFWIWEVGKPSNPTHEGIYNDFDIFNASSWASRHTHVLSLNPLS